MRNASVRYLGNGSYLHVAAAILNIPVLNKPHLLSFTHNKHSNTQYKLSHTPYLNTPSQQTQ
jgi:hypothetical protein